MLHRHLNHSDYTLAAIDNVIDRGQWPDWLALRRAALADPDVLAKVHKVCLAHAANAYAQRHAFWWHFAYRHGAAPGTDIPDPVVQRPAHMTGKLNGIDTGIREFSRTAALIPGAPETLRLIAIQVLKNNAAQDYIDFAASAARLSPAAAAQALHWLDLLYPQLNGQSPLQQLLVQLASPIPYDLDRQDDTKWRAVEAACLDTALAIFDPVNGTP